MAAVAAAAQAKVPWASIQIHKAFGVASAAHYAPGAYVLAWPSAESGALPVEGGVAVAFHREIAMAADPDRKPIYAHRGVTSTEKENTLPAFEKAIKLGVDYVEFDVRTAKDGAFFILHDGGFNRTTDGKGPISESDTATIRGLSAGQWFGAPFAGQKIPTLVATGTQVWPSWS